MLISDYGPYSLSALVIDSSGRSFYDIRGRMIWGDLEGTVQHTVEEGDTLWTIADRYYSTAGDGRGARLWWAIADFQPQPINDPTIALVVGSRLFVPPLRAVLATLTGGLEDEFLEAE